MERQVNYIQVKVDKIDDRLDNIDKTLAVNTELLGEHIKRTNILETEVRAVRDHVHIVRFVTRVAVWTLGVLITLLGSIFGLHLSSH